MADRRNLSYSADFMWAYVRMDSGQSHRTTARMVASLERRDRSALASQTRPLRSESVIATADPGAKVARALKVPPACACVSERDVSSEQNSGDRRREEAGTGQRSSGCWSRKTALVGSSGRKGKYVGRSPK